MIRGLHILLGLSAMLLVGMLHAQQTPVSAQYQLHPPLVNPAAISLKNSINGAMLIQRQWWGHEDAPTTFYLNANAPLINDDNMVGILVVNDNISIHNVFKFSAIYSRKFKLDQGSFFSLALSPGLELIQSDYSKINTDFAGDPIFAGQSVTQTSFNSGFGGYYYNKRFYAGVSIPRLMYNYQEGGNNGESSPKTTIDLNQMPLYVNLGWKKDLGPIVTFKPSAMVRYQQGSPMQIDFNALFEYRETIGVGVSYRTMNSMNFLANYKLPGDFQVGYAYSMQFGSQLNPYHSGSHEIMLIYGMGNVSRTNIDLPDQVRDYRKQKDKDVKRAKRGGKKKAGKVKGAPGGARDRKQPYS
ncbi:type IX secretion system membrane protein PorP/SprF [bacterium SCSIO 12741]|nr:type IX secretion system membrane protein PorP/SprF [bacterium SCSIO 12741]